MKASYKKGINLIEALITLIMSGIILVGTIDMMSRLFSENVDFNNDVQAMQERRISSGRISEKIKEAAAIYSIDSSIIVPVGNSYTSVKIGDNAIAVLVPEFDSSGTVVTPSATTTSFKGIAFAIVPESSWNGKASGKYVLIETNYDVTLSTYSDDPLKVSDSALPDDWRSGNSYLLAENLEPAIFSNMGTKAFDVVDNLVTFAFVPTPKALYFASSLGTKNVDDGAYLTTINFRNFRRM